MIRLQELISAAIDGTAFEGRVGETVSVGAEISYVEMAGAEFMAVTSVAHLPHLEQSGIVDPAIVEVLSISDECKQ